MIPIYKPWIGTEETENVLHCLKTGWISSKGEYIDKFEDELKNLLGCKHAITVSNGTTSLMLILAARGLSYGDKVLVPSLTYAATVSQAIWLGVTPILFDSDENGQPSYESMKNAYDSYSKEEQESIKAIILPELYGNCPDIVNFINYAFIKKLTLIEDSAEVFGSTYSDESYHCKDKHLGTFGYAGSFSFFGNKVITTGEGGLITTNEDSFASKVKEMKSQSHMVNFIHNGPGFNFRMTNIQAAIGLAQLSKLNSILELKSDLYKFYLENIPSSYQAILVNQNLKSSHWMPLFLLPENLSYTDFRDKMLSEGVDVRPCFPPIHRQPNWTYESPVSLKQGTLLSKRGFNLPSYPTITDEEKEQVIKALNKAIL